MTYGGVAQGRTILAVAGEQLLSLLCLGSLKPRISCFKILESNTEASYSHIRIDIYMHTILNSDTLY